jgi:hypothetical protein
MAWWIIGTMHLQVRGGMPPLGNRPVEGGNSATSGRTETKATRYLPAAVIPLAAVPTHQESRNQRNTRWHGARAGSLMRWWTTCSTQSRARDRSSDPAERTEHVWLSPSTLPGVGCRTAPETVANVKHCNHRPMSSRSHRNSGDAVEEAGTDYDAVDRLQVEPAVSMQIAESPQHA